MEIIKNNIQNLGWSEEFSCIGCKSELKAEEKDIMLRVDLQSRGWGKDEFVAVYYVCCPLCQTKKEIERVKPAYEETNNVPRYRARLLRNKLKIDDEFSIQVAYLVTR